MNKLAIPAIVLALCLALVASRSLTQERPPAGTEQVQATEDGQVPEQPPVIEDVDLQALIDQADDGDTIIIASGTYMIESGLVIRGREDLTIICESPVNIFCNDALGNVLTIRESTGITLAGARLRHVDPDVEMTCGGVVVLVQESSDVLVYRCELDGCGVVGASVFSSRNVHIHQCYIHDNSSLALFVYDSDEVKITDNRIVNNQSMLSVHATENQRLEMWGNTIENNAGPPQPDDEATDQFEQLDEQIDAPQKPE